MSLLPRAGRSPVNFTKTLAALTWDIIIRCCSKERENQPNTRITVKAQQSSEVELEIKWFQRSFSSLGTL